jgi:phosphate transport system substrate-binding protein
MKFPKRTRILALMLAGIMLLAVSLAGCGKETTTHTTQKPALTTTATTTAVQTQNQTQTQTMTNTVTSTTTVAPPELSGAITESGSTTVQPLAEKLANAFTTANPKVKIVIQGGGSAVGIKAANDGTVDIGAASRELTSSDPALQKFLLCRDGIAIIVSPSNPVTDLTKQQIVDIFSGKITNWKDAGGQDKSIHVVAREEGSGTRTAFQELVMGKDAAGKDVIIVKNAILQNSSGAIMQTVAGDAQAISFDSFGYVDKTVKALSIGGVAATSDNAKTGKYPIIRPLYFLTKNAPTGLVKTFLDYCQSDAAQKMIVTEGYISTK